MIPIVTVWPMPSGFPSASATSPTRTLSESPSWSVCRLALSILRTAEIARRIRSDDLGHHRPPVAELDCHMVGVLDDVIVGEDVAVGAHDDARAEAALTPLLGLAAATRRAELIPEELPQERVVRHLGAGVAYAALGLHRDDRRRDLLDEGRVRIGGAAEGTRAMHRRAPRRPRPAGRRARGRRRQPTHSTR